LIATPKKGETREEWARRCGVIRNVGEDTVVDRPRKDHGWPDVPLLLDDSVPDAYWLPDPPNVRARITDIRGPGEDHVACGFDEQLPKRNDAADSGALV